MTDRCDAEPERGAARMPCNGLHQQVRHVSTKKRKNLIDIQNGVSNQIDADVRLCEREQMGHAKLPGHRYKIFHDVVLADLRVWAIRLNMHLNGNDH